MRLFLPAGAAKGPELRESELLFKNAKRRVLFRRGERLCQTDVDMGRRALTQGREHRD